MLQRRGIRKILAFIFALTLCCAAAAGYAEKEFELKRVGNINSYGDNAFLVKTTEAGTVTIKIHDNICVYRTLTEKVPAGETKIRWDGCGYNQERLYEKTYTITAELVTESGKTHTVSFDSPVEYVRQFLQYAMPSSDRLYLDAMKDWFLEFRTSAKGTVRMEMVSGDTKYSYSFSATGGKIARKEFDSFVGRKIPKEGDYTVSVYETSRPEQAYTFPLTVMKTAPEKQPVTVTGEIMPERGMSDGEIWNLMMQPSVVVDIDFFKHQDVYEKPDEGSRSLGTLHGQTQGLKVIAKEGKWAKIGAWNHEEAEYVEGWVPLAKLKVETPHPKYGILIDKQMQTMWIYEEGKVIDRLLVSTGRAAKNSLYQETSAGCFLTGYHRVNFSMNGKKYDYVIQYDGGNLLHQTPYDWGQHKKDFTLGRGYLGAKASHACIRIQPEPGEGGLNAYWIFTHIPYHTRVIILDDPDERTAATNRLTRGKKADVDVSALKAETGEPTHEGTVTMTFGGSLTPGGTKAFNSRKESFVSFLKTSGYRAALEGLKSIFEQDDLTCVNICAPMQGALDAFPDKKGAVCAPKGTEEIFRDASVELVQLTDDRIRAYGKDLRKATAEAVKPYAAVLERDRTVTLKIKGHLFGFAGCSESEYLKDPGIIDRRVGELKEQQCERIICLMSWGEDKASEHSVVQEAMAHRCVRAGADLVVGSHPGVIQGAEYTCGVPVIYSTGDLLDGSNTAKPKAQQGMLVRAAFSFEEGEEPLKLTVIPIQPCGTKTKDKNDYSPTAELTKKAAESILRCLWQDTADQVLDRLTFRLPGQS